MQSVKREGEGETSSSKMMKGAAGGGVAKGGGSQDGKTNPIPRNLSTQSITLNFVQRTWEEIGPGELKYLPLSVTPRYMFDPAMRQQFKKFDNLWSTMEIHQPHARLTNLIMLQDDLINQGGTPMETTAFTQACYMLTFKPRGQSQYFGLGSINCGSNIVQPLSYDFSTISCDQPNSQLLDMQGYEEFEKLAVMPAKLNINAGPSTKQTFQANITDPYIHPQTGTLGETFSGNMQVGPEHFLKPLKTITYAKNMDQISLHKYGDTVTIPIKTNLEGLKLLRHEQNNIFTDKFSVPTGPTTPNLTYNSEFYYPSVNRPYFSRGDNFNAIKPAELLKKNGHLEHVFLTMPPIKKANKALLKQRCSFMLEQHFSVTFNFPQSIWHSDDAGEEPEDDFYLAQKSGVILRPNMYGRQDITPTPQGPFCPRGGIQCGSNLPGVRLADCPRENTFDNLMMWLLNLNHLDKISGEGDKAFYSFKNPIVKLEMPDDNIMPDDRLKFTWNLINYMKKSTFQELYYAKDRIIIEIYSLVKTGNKIDCPYLFSGNNEDGELTYVTDKTVERKSLAAPQMIFNPNVFKLQSAVDNTYSTFVIFQKEIVMSQFAADGGKCDVVAQAPVSRVANVFFK